MSSRVKYLRDCHDMKHVVEHLSMVDNTHIYTVSDTLFAPFFEDDIDSISDASTHLINSGLSISSASIPQGLIVRLIELLKRGPQLCTIALSVLTFISAGLTFNTNEFLAGNFPDIVMQLLLAPASLDVISPTIVVIGNLIGDGTLLISNFLSAGFLDAIKDIAVAHAKNMQLIQDICWSICNFSRHIRDKDFAYTTDQLHKISATIVLLLPITETNDQARYYIGWALSYSLVSTQCANYYDKTPAFLYTLKYCDLRARNVNATVAFLKSLSGFLKQNITVGKLDLLVRGPVSQQILSSGNNMNTTIYVILIEIWTQILELDLRDTNLQEPEQLDHAFVESLLASKIVASPLALMVGEFTSDTIYEVAMRLIPRFFQLCPKKGQNSILQTITFFTEFIYGAPVSICQQLVESDDFMAFLQLCLRDATTDQGKEYTEKILKLILAVLELPSASIEVLQAEFATRDMVPLISHLGQDASTSMLVKDILSSLGEMQGYDE